MTKIEGILEDKITERERTVYFFLQVPPRASFPQLLMLDEEIANLRYLVARERASKTRGSFCTT